jgi:exosortase
MFTVQTDSALNTRSISAPGSGENRGYRLRFYPFALALVFGTLWIELFRQLQPEWALNPQYSYGWLVPLLALYLLIHAWKLRPEPGPVPSRLGVVSIAILAAIALWPIRLVAEANPDWRPVSWSLAISVVVLSFCGLSLAGGWPWVRHFAFPVLFTLVAVPWPTQFEQVVIQRLMYLETTINVDLLRAFGIAALQHGNVIEVNHNLVGVEEACSGIRSLQATLMISLFLGAFYEFTILPRVILIAAGAIVAFLFNLTRTMILVWIAATRGIEELEKWHDSAGMTILFVCLFALWGLSIWMRKRQKWSRADNPLPPGNRRARSVSWSFLAALGIWLVIMEVGVAMWYRSDPSHKLTAARWNVQWPVNAEAYRTVPIGDTAQSLLRYNEGGGALWRTDAGHIFNMFFFRWLPGRTAALFVRVHRPDVCLPAIGMTLRSESKIRIFTINNIQLPVRAYTFDDKGTPVHVFYCYWDGSVNTDKVATGEDWSPSGRLSAVWNGKRNVGAQTLEIAVWGYKDDADAEKALVDQLGNVLRGS